MVSGKGLAGEPAPPKPVRAGETPALLSNAVRLSGNYKEKQDLGRYKVKDQKSYEYRL